MLVMSRRRSDQIMIGDEIVITVIDIRGDKVRLAIEAPPYLPVHRSEVWEILQQERGQAPPRIPRIANPGQQEQSFLREIEADPDDLTNYSVFADWLDERGDLRAELIRIDLKINKLYADGTRFQKHADLHNLLARRKELERAWSESTQSTES